MSETQDSTIEELRAKLRGERAAFAAYRSSIDLAVRMGERIGLEDLELVELQADAARVVAEGRS